MVTSTLKKFKYYADNYLFAYKWIKVLLIPSIVVLVLINFLEVQTMTKIVMFTKEKTDADGWILITIAASLLFQGFLKVFFDIFSSYMVSYIVQKAYADFFGEYLHITYAEYSKYGIGEKHYAIRRRAVAISMFFTSFAVKFICDFFFFAWIMINVCTKLSLPSMFKVLGMVCIFIICLFILHGVRSTIRRKANSGFEEAGKKMYDVLFSYERIVAYNNLDEESRKYKKSMSNQYKYNVIFWTVTELGDFLLAAMFCFLTVFIFYEFHGSTFMSEKEAIDDAAVLSALLKSLEGKVKLMAKLLSNLVTQYTNFDQSLIEHAELEKVNKGIQIKTFEDSLVTKNIEFAYNKKVIFTNVNCGITKGQKIAIVGANGTGKSTFLKLLLGFCTYNGSVELDGWDYKNISLAHLRQLISYIPQHSQLFDLTILENIKAGNKNMSTEEIVQICDKFEYHSLFKELGYDKRVGSRGRNLSGGERQKISFMRAVVKNAPIILMDEPTANLDAASEKDFIKHVTKVLKTTTILMIVHNLETLKEFDSIYFFRDKTLGAMSSFDELYNNNTHFREFYSSEQKKSQLLK